MRHSFSFLSLNVPRPMSEASRVVVCPTNLQCLCRCRLRLSSTGKSLRTGGATVAVELAAGVCPIVLCSLLVRVNWLELDGLFFDEPSVTVPSSSFRFLGWAFSTNVHSCLWNSQSTQRRDSWSTHLLFLLRQPSQGLSFLERAAGADCWSCLRAAGRFSLPLMKGMAELQATMGRGASAGAAAMTVAIAALWIWNTGPIDVGITDIKIGLRPRPPEMAM